MLYSVSPRVPGKIQQLPTVSTCSIKHLPLAFPLAMCPIPLSPVIPVVAPQINHHVPKSFFQGLLWENPTRTIYGILGPGVVAHTCNPRYSGGGDQEDYGLRIAGMKSS
jgi:hypothetical protein